MKKIFYKYFLPFLFISVVPLLLSSSVLFLLFNRDITLMGGGIINQSSEVLKTTISSKNEAIACVIGHRAEKPISEVFQKIITMSQSPVLRSTDLRNIELYCSTVVYNKPSILELSVVNEQGDEIFKISRVFAVAKESYKNISETEAFVAMEKGYPYLSEVFISETTHLPYVVVAQPIERYSNKFIGGIVASIDLGFIWDIVVKEPVAKKGLVYIISDKGLLISHPSKKEVYENPDYYKYDYIKKVLEEREGSFIKGEKLVSFSANNYLWETVIEMPTKEALSSIEEHKHAIYKHMQSTFQTIAITDLTTIVFVLVISILLGIYVTKKITAPILTLKEATAKVSKGDFSARVTIARDDELGELANSFNNMAINLKNITVSRDELVKEIAERKKAEEALRASEAKYRVLAENLPQKIFLKDRNSVYISCNENYARDLKIEAEEIEGKTDYDFHPKELAEKCRTDDKKIMEKGEIADIEEKYIQDGKEFFVHTVKTPVKDERGNVIGILGIFRDITEHRKIEESSRLAQLGKLVSSMAHEVNNPLMIISGNAQLCLMEEIKSEEVKNNLKIIVGESKRAKDIIRRLLKFSRPSKGEIKEVDINKSIEAVGGIVEHQFKLANIEIKRNYLETLPLISVDEQQMQEVFMNLINNAVEAMPDGGVITITTSLEGDFLRIDFKDTGSGMSEEVKKKVLEPFFTTKEKGTGLGLSVCYGIIMAHNGEIKFESKLNKGTTVSVLLPLGGKA